jgi:hypothetical protein
VAHPPNHSPPTHQHEKHDLTTQEKRMGRLGAIIFRQHHLLTALHTTCELERFPTIRSLIQKFDALSKQIPIPSFFLFFPIRLCDIAGDSHQLQNSNESNRITFSDYPQTG